MKSTLLIPTLNEIEAIQVIMPQIDKSWINEIICIDGGSTDGTVEYFKENGYTVYSQQGRGFGTGMKEGMDKAEGEVIVEFTPDGNSIPSRILDLIGKYQEGYDMVICSRFTDYAKCEEDDFVTRFGN